MDHSETKWNRCTLLFQFSSTVEDWRTKHGTEDLSKACLLSGKGMDNSSTCSKLTTWGRVLFDIRHIPPHWALIRRKRFAFGVTPCYLLWINTIKRRLVILSTQVCLFSLLSFFLRSAPLCKSWCAENVARLRFARGKAAGSDWLYRSSSGGDGTGVDALWWDSTQQIGKRTYSFVFFFSGIGKNQCGRTTRNTEKNLHCLMYSWLQS